LIIVTEEAKALLATIEHPEGTVLRLDPVTQDQATEQITLSFAPGEPHGDDQIVEQEGEEVLRIAAPVSELLNGSTMDVVVQEESENGAERPSVVIGIRPPGHEPPASGS
jgi:iron-sulfur cluster assembly protein